MWLDTCMEATVNPEAITDIPTDRLADLHAEGTRVMRETRSSRTGYRLAVTVVTAVETELNRRGLIAQENEDFEVVGWAAA